MMNNKKIILSIALLSLIIGVTLSQSTSSSSLNPIVSCPDLFATSGNQYLPALAGITGYGSIVGIAGLIILVVLMISGVAYALGFSFHSDTLLNFSRTEILEAAGNLVILAVVGGAMAFAAAPMIFFANLAGLQAGTSSAIPSNVHSLYVNLCENTQNNIVLSGLSNWFGVFLNLYVSNFLAVGAPPEGGFTLHLMPNGYGIAFSPFQGISVVTALLWDEQMTYFGAMFMGMFIIVFLFMIYFLFPIFFYVGIALRCFPWTRAAGGSFIALFIAFYIIFPSLMYPFVVSNVVNSVVNPNAGQGFCNSSQFSGQFGSLCDTGGLLSSLSKYTDLFNLQFGSLFYAQIYGFVNGIEQVGISLVGLIISMLISYELVEKLGNMLGSPSLQGSRLLGRIL